MCLLRKHGDHTCMIPLSLYGSDLTHKSHHARTLDACYVCTFWANLQAPSLLMTCYFQEKSHFFLSIDLVNLFHQKMPFHHLYGVKYSFFGHQTFFIEYRATLFFCLVKWALLWQQNDLLCCFSFIFVGQWADEYCICPSKFFSLVLILKYAKKLQLVALRLSDLTDST